jgi:hypothetical protein
LAGPKNTTRFLLVALALAGAVGPLRAEEPGAKAPPARPAFTDAEKERFLLEGRILRRRSTPQGVTNSEIATLSLDGLEHDAHIQDVDEHERVARMGGKVEVDFRDSWQGNVAAYRLDRLLGLGMVPVTVARHDGPRPASFTWWVDDFLMDEKARQQRKVRVPDAEGWNRQMYALRIFDQLIYNFDRNAGNLAIDTAWRIWMIDHTRAFKNLDEIRSPKSLGKRCPRGLLEGLRRLDRVTLEKSLDEVLDGYQIGALLRRRDAIVRHFEARIARHGERAVLYDLPSRVEATAAPR